MSAIWAKTPAPCLRQRKLGLIGGRNRSLDSMELARVTRLCPGASLQSLVRQGALNRPAGGGGKIVNCRQKFALAQRARPVSLR